MSHSFAHFCLSNMLDSPLMKDADLSLLYAVFTVSSVCGRGFSTLFGVTRMRHLIAIVT